jgi:hypothetical protein
LSEALCGEGLGEGLSEALCGEGLGEGLSEALCGEGLDAELGEERYEELDVVPDTEPGA